MNDHARVGDPIQPFGVPAGRIDDVSWIAPATEDRELVENQIS
jgi:hypothetical protein